MIGINEQKQEITAAVAARIRYFRRLKGFSQEELALKAGLNPAYFGQVERGLKCPTVDTLYKIAKALEVPLPELLRFDTSSNCSEENLERLKDLLSRVPPEKMDQVFQVIEDVLRLF